MLNSTLLKAFMNGFFGYGNPEAPMWFIAMEEGGGKSESEIAARIKAWHERGQRKIENLRDFCGATRHPSLMAYSLKSLPYQATWLGMVNYQLANTDNSSPSGALVYQKTKWLVDGGNSCLLNLFPLPSPKVSDWNYADWNDLEFLRSREAYKRELWDGRIATIRKLITQYHPERIVFCSTSYNYQQDWIRIQSGFTTTEFVTIAHPSRRSASSISTPTLPMSPVIPPLTSAPATTSTDRFIVFFEQLFEALRASGRYNYLETQFVTRRDDTSHWQSLHVGPTSPKDVFLVSFERKKNDLFRLEYTLDGSGDGLYKRLLSQKTKIEAKAGFALDWDEAGNSGARKRRQILLRYNGVDNDSARIDWILTKLDPFIKALSAFS